MIISNFGRLSKIERSLNKKKLERERGAGVGEGGGILKGQKMSQKLNPSLSLKWNVFFFNFISIVEIQVALKSCYWSISNKENCDLKNE